MKPFLLICTFLLVFSKIPCTGSLFGQTTKTETAEAGGIDFFHGTWAELLQKAKKFKKPFFVDFYTTWCGPCKMMAKTTFKDKAVANYINQHGLAYKVDCESEAGAPIASQYQIQAYPTIIFFDASGNVVNTVVGALGAEAFLAEAKKNFSIKGTNTTGKGPKATEVVTTGAEKDDLSPNTLPATFLKTTSITIKSLEAKIFDTTRLARIRELATTTNDFDFEEEVLPKVPETLRPLYKALFWAEAAKADKVVSTLQPLVEKNTISDPGILYYFALRCIRLQHTSPEVLQWLNASLREAPSFEKWETKALLAWRKNKYADAREAATKALKAAKAEGVTNTRLVETILRESK